MKKKNIKKRQQETKIQETALKMLLPEWIVILSETEQNFIGKFIFSMSEKRKHETRVNSQNFILLNHFHMLFYLWLTLFFTKYVFN